MRIMSCALLHHHPWCFTGSDQQETILEENEDIVESKKQTFIHAVPADDDIAAPLFEQKPKPVAPTAVHKAPSAVCTEVHPS